MCGADLISLRWVRPVVKVLLVSLVIFFLAATYAYSYVPQLGAYPTPSWPTPTSTPTNTVTPTVTVPAPTRTRTLTPTSVPPTVTKVPPLTYTVIFGDTLWDIAMSHNTSVDAIKIANGMGDDYVIKPGQVLIIPRGTPTPPVQPSATPRPQAPVTRLPVATSTPNP